MVCSMTFLDKAWCIRTTARINPVKEVPTVTRWTTVDPTAILQLAREEECVFASERTTTLLSTQGLRAAENKPTGYFVIDENDQGISAMYTEPVLVTERGNSGVPRRGSASPGIISLAVGMSVLIRVRQVLLQRSA